MNPLAIGAVSAGVVGVGTGIAVTRITDGIAARHPTGSEADGPAQAWSIGTSALGFATAAGGMVALAKGRLQLGAALVGGGAGAMIGGIAGGIAFGARHGVGVESAVSDVLSNYDRNRDGAIDMAQSSWWRSPETYRTETRTWRDSDGDTHWETDTYSIERLAMRADADGDQVATGAELRSTIAGYDEDSDGRLQKDELKRFEREVGEQHVW
jgi:hypothetical protein